MKNIKDKIIKWLGGYTDKEYNEVIFPKIVPTIKLIKTYHPVTISVELRIDNADNPIYSEDYIKKEVAVNLANKLIDDIEYSYISESMYNHQYDQQIVRGTITIMKGER